MLPDDALCGAVVGSKHDCHSSALTCATLTPIPLKDWDRPLSNHLSTLFSLFRCLCPSKSLTSVLGHDDSDLEVSASVQL